MSEINENYKRIITQIEQKITNKDDLEFVLERIDELTNMFLDVMDKMSVKTEKRMEQIENKQRIIEQKVSNVAKAIDEIENDMYEEIEEDDTLDERESDYDLEILCPYCNNDFIEPIYESDENLINEVQCPKCHNIIELDWENGKDEKNIDEDDDM